MKENRQHIDDIFKQQLGDYTEVPDAAVWTMLEQQLDEKPGRKRIAVWFWLLLLCLTAAGISIPVSYYGQKREGKNSFTQTIPVRQTPQLIQAHTTDNKQATNNTSTDKNSIAKNTNNPAQTIAVRSVPTTGNTNTATVTAETITPAIPSTPVAITEIVPATAIERHKEKIFSLSPRGHQMLSIALQTALNLPEVIIQTIQRETSYQTQKLHQGRSKLLAVTPAATPYYAYTSAAYFATAGDILSANETIDTALAATEAGAPAATAAISEASNATQIADTNSSIHKNRFIFGVKGGYEFATQANALNKIVVSPYVQYMLSSRFSLMTQPAVKYANVHPTELSKNSYYNTIDTLVDPDTRTNGPNTMVRTLFYQTEYDSIIITNRIKGSNQWQIDIPLMLNYKLKKNLDVYGGVNINIAKPAQIEMDQQAYRIVRYDTIELTAITPTGGVGSNFTTYPDAPPASEVFSHGSAQPFSSYNNAMYENPTQNPLKYGITLGFSYNFKQRLLFDFLYTQNLSGMSYIPNETVRKMYNQPYFRFTLGFRLTK